MPLSEKGNSAVRESEVEITLNATETGETIRRHFPKVFFIEPVKKAALNVQGSF
jgi:hypothetical protein